MKWIHLLQFCNKSRSSLPKILQQHHLCSHCRFWFWVWISSRSFLQLHSDASRSNDFWWAMMFSCLIFDTISLDPRSLIASDYQSGIISIWSQNDHWYWQTLTVLPSSDACQTKDYSRRVARAQRAERRCDPPCEAGIASWNVDELVNSDSSVASGVCLQLFSVQKTSAFTFVLGGKVAVLISVFGVSGLPHQ